MDSACCRCQVPVKSDHPRFTLTITMGGKDMVLVFGSGLCLRAWLDDHAPAAATATVKPPVFAFVPAPVRDV